MTSERQEAGAGRDQPGTCAGEHDCAPEIYYRAKEFGIGYRAKEFGIGTWLAF